MLLFYRETFQGITQEVLEPISKFSRLKVTAQVYKNQEYTDNKQSEVKTIPLIIALK